jgi:hypothetical protein
MLRFYGGRDFVEVGGLMSYGTGLSKLTAKSVCDITM